MNSENEEPFFLPTSDEMIETYLSNYTNLVSFTASKNKFKSVKKRRRLPRRLIS